MSPTRRQPGRGQEGIPFALKALLLLTLAWVAGGGAFLALRSDEPETRAANPATPTQTIPTTIPTTAPPPSEERPQPVKEAPREPERLGDEEYRQRAELRAEAVADRVEGVEAEEAGVNALAALLVELDKERAALEATRPAGDEGGSSKARALMVLDALVCFAASEREGLAALKRADEERAAAAHAEGDSCRLAAVGLLEDWPES